MARLEHIINEARLLSAVEKQQLRDALELELEREQAQNQTLTTQNGNGDDEDIRVRRLEWLKAHREEYGGQYVALDRDILLAVGPTFRAAREKALAAGKPGAFVTYLSKPDEVAEMGGWE
jgi:hypothetical protein